jgi:hypothetical protein
MLFAKADGAVTAASERQAMPQLSKYGRKNTLLIAIPIKSGQESRKGGFRPYNSDSGPVMGSVSEAYGNVVGPD